MNRRVAMGFSIKIAPGVRVRASRRGIRPSVGPRIARVHVGAGRAGMSTGASPVGLYAALGATHKRPAVGGRPGGPPLTLMDKTALAAEAQQQLDAIYSLHRDNSRPAEHRLAPEPAPPDTQEISISTGSAWSPTNRAPSWRRWPVRWR
jgi:hypothetical protein